jgi:hypothetical protein
MLAHAAIMHSRHGCLATRAEIESLAQLHVPVEGVPCESSLNSLLLLAR